jgi:hypothetical protein
MFTKEELEAKLIPMGDSWDSSWWENYSTTTAPWGYLGLEGRTYDLGEPFGIAKCVARLGENHDGSKIRIIIEVDGRLFERDGWYSSWDDDEWEYYLTEVEQFERTIIDYRPIS